jgi:hypothetical protein
VQKGERWGLGWLRGTEKGERWLRLAERYKMGERLFRLAVKYRKGERWFGLDMKDCYVCLCHNKEVEWFRLDMVRRLVEGKPNLYLSAGESCKSILGWLWKTPECCNQA